MSAEMYEGGHDYESMAAFTKEHITKPMCSIFKKENCTPEEQQIIANIESKTDEELVAESKDIEKLVIAEEIKFDEEVSEIQKKYDDLVDKFNAELDRIKEKHNYQFLEQVMGTRNLGGDDDDEEYEGYESDEF